MRTQQTRQGSWRQEGLTWAMAPAAAPSFKQRDKNIRGQSPQGTSLSAHSGSPVHPNPYPGAPQPHHRESENAEVLSC